MKAASRRSTSAASAKTGGGRLFMVIIKSSLIASAVSILLIVIYALLLYKQVLQSDSVAVVNSVIKVVSAAVAAFIAVRKCTEKRWLIGGIAGLSYTLLAFLIFSILSATFEFSLPLLSDIGMGALSGMLAAMTMSIIGK